jgi:excisionase family DNA binding protein
MSDGPDDIHPDVLDAYEVAEALDVSYATALKFIRNGSIPGVLRASKPYRVSRATFAAWLKGPGVRE